MRSSAFGHTGVRNVFLNRAIGTQETCTSRDRHSMSFTLSVTVILTDLDIKMFVIYGGLNDGTQSHSSNSTNEPVPNTLCRWRLITITLTAGIQSIIHGMQ